MKRGAFCRKVIFKVYTLPCHKKLLEHICELKRYITNQVSSDCNSNLKNEGQTCCVYIPISKGLSNITEY